MEREAAKVCHRPLSDLRFGLGLGIALESPVEPVATRYICRVQIANGYDQFTRVSWGVDLSRTPHGRS